MLTIFSNLELSGRFVLIMDGLCPPVFQPPVQLLGGFHP
jgi:hypothetical protein